LFTAAILKDDPVPVFGGGSLRRDFTWIGDVVPPIVRLVETPFVGGEGAPHRIYNLGNSHPSDVMTLIRLIEQATGKKALIEPRSGPPGDVRETFADITRATRDLDFQPATPLEAGIPRFVTWFKEYARSNN
jgi:UDP-glucuronate 4-epimerase